MQVTATYDQGRLNFVRPINLKRQPLTLLVEIPDDAIADADPSQSPFPTYDLNDFPEAVRREYAKLDVFRQKAYESTGYHDETEKLETEDQRERWQAVEFRNSLRREQGRPL